MFYAAIGNQNRCLNLQVNIFSFFYVAIKIHPVLNEYLLSLFKYVKLKFSISQNVKERVNLVKGMMKHKV